MSNLGRVDASSRARRHWAVCVSSCNNPPVPRRVIHDFTIRADSTCHRCGYLLTGLRPAGRCPECSTWVVESLYLANERRRLGAEDRAIARLELDVLRTSWWPAPWLGAIGLLALSARLYLGRALDGPGPPIDALLGAAAASAAVMYAVLRWLERIGLAGFVSRRSVVLLILLVHLFAVGVVALAASPAAGVAAAMVFAAAAIPLRWLLTANAPEPGIAFGVLLAAAAIGMLFFGLVV